jgi:predicted porin
MKKHLIAAAALATLSTAAFAQSATVYGIFDLSVSKVSNTTSTNGSSTELTDAVWMPSVFGITGSEDLGGGLKASFNLESDINVDTGAISAASNATGYTSARSSKLFGRKANINLSGSFGTLTAGKDIDMIFLQGFIDNVRNSHSASGFIAHTLASDLRLDTESVFIENMIRYTTPSFNGFKASVQHRFGEVAGETGTNTSTAYLVNYSANGLSVSAGVKDMSDTTYQKNELVNAITNASTVPGGVKGADSKLSYLGVTYQMGPARLSATRHETKFEGTASSTAKIKTSEFGVGYAVSPKLNAAVNYVKTEQGANEGDITSASLKYALSKRTSLWTMVARTNYDGFNIGGGNYSVDPAAGKDSTSTSVGITHTF